MISGLERRILEETDGIKGSSRDDEKTFTLKKGYKSNTPGRRKMEDHTAWLFIVTLIATAAWHTQGGQTAIVRSQHEFITAFKEMLRNSGVNKVRDARSTNREEGDRAQHLCDSNPCGWSVYKKFTREFDGYVRNICQCADDSYKCVHVEDDLSINAYVYRCRQNTTANDTVAPPGDTN